MTNYKYSYKFLGALGALPMLFKHPVTSIDFSERYIKILSFSGWFKKKVQLIGKIKLPEDSIVDGRFENKKNIVLSLRKLSRAMKISEGKRSALGVPVGEAETEVVELKSKKNEDLKLEISERAEEIWGEGLGDKAFAYHLFPEVSGKEKRRALLVTTSESALEEKISLVKAAKFKVGLIDLNSLALFNMVDFHSEFQKGLNVIVNIEYQTTQLVFVSNGEFSAEAKIEFGEKNYLDNVIEHLNIQHEQTRTVITNSLKYKNLLYTKYKDIIHSTHSLYLTQISSEIESYLGSEKNQRKFKKISQFFLTGDGCNHKSYGTTLGRKFQCKVEMMNPFKKFSTKGPFESRIRIEHNAFSIASGLANRGFYFVK